MDGMKKGMLPVSAIDWKALEAMTDDEIDYSDIPPLTDAFFERAQLWQPGKFAKKLDTGARGRYAIVS